jgi:GNAT superfamily N-acetyltransferase
MASGHIGLSPGAATEIRGALASDAAEMARLSAELGYPVSLAEMIRRLQRLLADGRHHVLVAADGASLLGWVHVEHRCSLEAGERSELMGMVVDPAARRRGLGRSLVEQAESWSLARGLPAIVVRSNAARELSHPFYEALGYSRSKTQHVYAKRLN